MLGFALSYTYLDVDGDKGDDLEADTYQALLYSDIYATDELKFNIIAGLGFLENDGERKVLGKTLKSDYDSKFVQFGIGAYYDINLNDSFALTPYLRADYTHIKNDSYTEKGDDNLVLSVDSQDFDSLILQARLGGKFIVSDRLSLFA
ncbi:MAG: autotransporter outer membrane beta-barrel domain-containing protein [Campylobacter sp.]|nr:autotransporter outer membrane beta-barrel domain-containing protein [Campylobacter sp.]